MKILERLKLELNKQDYFTDKEYEQYLSENNLKKDEVYDKSKHQRQLLLTVLDILESISNDIDLMRKISDEQTGFTIDSAYKFLEKRLLALKNKIATLEVNHNTNIRQLFIKNR